MKNYSRQTDKFIESDLFATTYYRELDSRTWVSYYIADGMVHSSSFNYSILYSNPVNTLKFKELADKEPNCHVKYFKSL